MARSSPSRFAPRRKANARSEARNPAIVRLSGSEGSGERREHDKFARLVHAGLSGRPKCLPCQFFYDAAGSDLFEQICRLPEYYLTRTEDAILREHAAAMTADWAEPPTLIELGSGSAEKTRRLITAALEQYEGLHYVAIDVSASAVEASARQLVRAFPSLCVTGYVGDYHESLEPIAAHCQGPRLFIFLGSSLGNYEPGAAASLLGQVANLMEPADRLLLGTDMAKPANVLEPAYDDAQGITARFNRNLLVRINRELGGNFQPDQFQHKAIYRADRGRVEMHLISQSNQRVEIPGAALTVEFAEGESIHTENSHKYTAEGLDELAARAGLVEDAAWTDENGWFRVQRWRTRVNP